MSRYINADKLIGNLERWKFHIVVEYGEHDEYVKCIEQCIDTIEDLPTADVEEVRHGTADIISENAGIDDAINVSECSCCERTILTWGGEYPQFCSHCGAKMDKEKEE